MNEIEKLNTKFISLKKRLETDTISELFTREDNSILFLLNNLQSNNSFLAKKKEKKNKNNMENNPKSKSKSKDKNKFFTRKYPDQNVQNNLIQPKETSPFNKQPKGNILNTKSIFSKNPTKANIKQTNNLNSTNINSNNITNSKLKESISENINLLELENGDIKLKDAQKLFEVQRKMEDSKKNETKNDDENKNNNDNKAMVDNDIEDDSEFYDDEFENNDKKKKISKNDIFDNNLNIIKKESVINFNENFNIFDETKMIKDEDEDFNNSDDNSYNKNDNNNKYKEDKKKPINSKKNSIIKEKEIEKEKEKESKMNKKEEKNNEINEHENYEFLNSNHNNNSLKFCIPYDDELNEFDGQEKNDKKENKTINTNTNENSNTFEKGKKKDTKKKEINTNINSIKSLKSKSCFNTGSIKNHKNNISKKSNKIIMDDEEEGSNNRNKNTPNNNLLLSLPKNKNEKINTNTNKDKEKKESLITNEGNKFTLVLENENITKKSQSMKVDRIKSISENNDYDLICVNNINKALIQIQEKLQKENYEKKINEKCFEIIKSINNNQNDLKRRKKNTYLGILKILKIIFSLLYENKKCKMYKDEIFLILDSIQKYYKNVKKYEPWLNSDQYLYNKKISFKYIYSSLLLKNYDDKSLKELSKIDENSKSNDLIKFTKIYKRYRKTSEYLMKELKDFKEKINNPLNKTKFNIEFQNKYESCPSHIQTSPNFMTYSKLFNHYYIILNFFSDFKNFMNELEENKKERIINKSSDKDKNNQLNKNGFSEKIKNRERSRYKEREKEKEKERNKNNDAK